MWFDSGELERLSEILSGPKSVSESVLSLFTPSKPTRSRKGDK